TSSDNTVLYDNDPSRVTINQGAGQPDPTGAATITFDVVFSEPVFGFAASDVTLSGTLPGAAGLSKVVSGSGANYTVTVSGMAPRTQGTVAATLAAAVATDLAGNPNLAPTTTDNVVSFDGVIPTVIVTRAATQPDLTGGTSIAYAVTFSKPVTGFDASDVVLSGTLPGVAGLTKVVSGSGTNYTVTVTGMTPGTQGTVVATIVAGAAVDVAGNPSAAPTVSNNVVTYDTVSPTVTINRVGGPGPTNTSPTFAVVFSESVTGFTAADVSLAGSTVGGALVATVSGSGASYTVTV